MALNDADLIHGRLKKSSSTTITIPNRMFNYQVRLVSEAATTSWLRAIWHFGPNCPSPHRKQFFFQSLKFVLLRFLFIYSGCSIAGMIPIYYVATEDASSPFRPALNPPPPNMTTQPNAGPSPYAPTIKPGKSNDSLRLCVFGSMGRDWTGFF